MRGSLLLGRGRLPQVGRSLSTILTWWASEDPELSLGT